MLKFIIPAILIFFIVLFWEKITNFIEKKFNIKLNYIIVVIFLVVISIVLILLNY